MINSPTVRSVLFENVSLSTLVLELSASQPEDLELFVKLEDAPSMSKPPFLGRYADSEQGPERVTMPTKGEMKERFMETMREISTRETSKPSKPNGKTKDKGANKPTTDGEPSKQPVAVAVGAALKRGGRGRPVLVSEPVIVGRMS